MSYLENLKKKYSDGAGTQLHKLQKPNYYSYRSTDSEHLKIFLCRRWRLSFSDGRILVVHYSPVASHAEVEADAERWHGRGIQAEPLPDYDDPVTPVKPLSQQEEGLIRDWLDQISEKNPDEIADVIGRCRTDAGAKEYFLNLAKGETR